MFAQIVKDHRSTSSQQLHSRKLLMFFSRIYSLSNFQVQYH